MLKIKNYFIFIIFALIVYPFATFAQNSLNQEKNKTAIKQNIQKSLNNDKTAKTWIDDNSAGN
jgi:hypothetical protein